MTSRCMGSQIIYMFVSRPKFIVRLGLCRYYITICRTNTKPPATMMAMTVIKALETVWEAADAVTEGATGRLDELLEPEVFAEEGTREGDETPDGVVDALKVVTGDGKAPVVGSDGGAELVSLVDPLDESGGVLAEVDLPLAEVDVDAEVVPEEDEEVEVASSAL